MKKNSPVLIIVAYNSFAETTEAVNSFLVNFNTSLAVIVDNTRDLQHTATLRKYFEDFEMVKVLRPDQNLGFFGGLNFGIKFSKTLVPRETFYFLGNNDIFFPASFYQSYKALNLSSEHMLAIAPSVINSDGSNSNPHLVSYDLSFTKKTLLKVYYTNFYLAQFLTFLRSVIKPQNKKHIFNSSKISQAHGSFFILSGPLVEKLDLLPSPTFMYGEEFFLSRKLRLLNQRFIYKPELFIHHLGSLSVGAVLQKTRWGWQKQAWVLEQKLRNFDHKNSEKVRTK